VGEFGTSFVLLVVQRVRQALSRDFLKFKNNINVDNLLFPLMGGFFMLLAILITYVYLSWRSEQKKKQDLPLVVIPVSQPGTSTSAVTKTLPEPDQTTSFVVYGVATLKHLIEELKRTYEVSIFSSKVGNGEDFHNYKVSLKGNPVGVLSILTQIASTFYKNVAPEERITNETTVTLSNVNCDTECQVALLADVRKALQSGKLQKVELPRTQARVFTFKKTSFGSGWGASPYNIKVPLATSDELTAYYPVKSLKLEKEDLVATGNDAADMIRWASRNMKNVLVTGPTGSGKTTLVNIALNSPDTAVFLLPSGLIEAFSSADGPALADAMDIMAQGIKNRVVVIDEAAGPMARHKDILLTMMDGPLHQILNASIVLIACKAENEPEDLFRVGRMNVEIELDTLADGGAVVEFVRKQFPEMAVVASSKMPTTIAEVRSMLVTQGEAPPPLLRKEIV